MLVGFSPRKQNLTIYNMGGIDPDDALLKKLGKHTTGKGCLYIKRLDDVGPAHAEKPDRSVIHTNQRARRRAVTVIFYQSWQQQPLPAGAQV